MTQIDGRTTLVGIIGDPVAHSLSPRMHNAAFDAVPLNWRYVAFRVPAAGLAQALRGAAALGMVGFNVTIPHKESAATLVDDLDPAARQIGAVNTVRILGTRLQGFNTDGAGVLDALSTDGGVSIAGRRCIVIGAGGGGRAASFALAGAGASNVTVFNRTEEKVQSLVAAVRRTVPACAIEAAPLAVTAIERAVEGADVVVHATAATMSAAMGGGGGRADWLQVLIRRLRRGMVVLDMVYTPTWTELLEAAKASGAVAISGLSMLVFQGARSFEVWTGRSAPVSVMRQAVGLPATAGG
jgi:shikimate dehydrogenase